jgi:hypothetical protein
MSMKDSFVMKVERATAEEVKASGWQPRRPKWQPVSPKGKARRRFERNEGPFVEHPEIRGGKP